LFEYSFEIDFFVLGTLFLDVSELFLLPFCSPVGFEEYVCGEGVFRPVSMTLADWGQYDSMGIVEICEEVWGRTVCGGGR
jgi:hypothetical protein